MNEIVSVIIPTYKRTDTLDRAIKSVKNQTYDNIEIIVVDDNANNLKVRNNVKKIVKRYPEIILIENKKNLGGGLSRNEGIKKSKGKYIAFLDDDDEFYPQKIEKQYALFKEKESKNVKIGLVYCFSEYIYSNKIKKRKIDYSGIPLYQHLKVCIAATSWWFCSKKALMDIGGFENVSSHQDAITLFKLLKAGYEIYPVKEILVKYYAPDGNGITKVNQEWLNVDILYYKMYEEIKNRFTKKEQKDIDYSFFKRMSSYNYRLGNYPELKSNVKKMIKINFFNVSTIKAFIKLILLKFRRI